MKYRTDLIDHLADAIHGIRRHPGAEFEPAYAFHNFVARAVYSYLNWLQLLGQTTEPNLVIDWVKATMIGLSQIDEECIGVTEACKAYAMAQVSYPITCDLMAMANDRLNARHGCSLPVKFATDEERNDMRNGARQMAARTNQELIVDISGVSPAFTGNLLAVLEGVAEAGRGLDVLRVDLCSDQGDDLLMSIIQLAPALLWQEQAELYINFFKGKVCQENVALLVSRKTELAEAA